MLNVLSREVGKSWGSRASAAAFYLVFPPFIGGVRARVSPAFVSCFSPFHLGSIARHARKSPSERKEFASHTRVSRLSSSRAPFSLVPRTFYASESY